MQQTEWVYCPVCGNKTRDRIREDTVLINYASLLPEVQTRELDPGETTTYRCHQRARRIDAEPMNL